MKSTISISHTATQFFVDFSNFYTAVLGKYHFTSLSHAYILTVLELAKVRQVRIW